MKKFLSAVLCVCMVLSSFVFVAGAAEEYTITFDRAQGVGIMAPVKVAAGSTYTLPAIAFTRVGYEPICWISDGVTYSAGDKVDVNSDMVFTCYYEETQELPAIMGASFEFETDGDTDGVAADYLCEYVKAENGVLVVRKSDYGQSTCRISIPVTHMDPSYSVLKVVYDPRGYNDSFATYFTPYGRGWGPVADDGTVRYKYISTANRGKQEVICDYSDYTNASGDWMDAKLAGFWMDVINGYNDGGDGRIFIESIRFYLKGDKTVKYDANADGDTVTSMPQDDTMAARGTGYMVSALEPSRAGYSFVGWSLDAESGDVVETIDITEDETTLYAVWEETYEVAAYFENTIEAEGEQAEVLGETFKAIELPECAFTKEGYEFAGWQSATDGKIYSAGTNYTMGAEDEFFTAVWNIAAEVEVYPADGAELDYRDVEAVFTFPAPVNPEITAETLGAAAIEISDEGYTVKAYGGFYDMMPGKTVTFGGTVATDEDPTVSMIVPEVTYTVKADPAKYGDNLIVNGDFEKAYAPTHALGKAWGEVVEDENGNGYLEMRDNSMQYGRLYWYAGLKTGTNHYVRFKIKALPSTTGVESYSARFSFCYNGLTSEKLYRDIGTFGPQDGWQQVSFELYDGYLDTKFDDTGVVFVMTNDVIGGGYAQFAIDDFEIRPYVNVTYNAGAETATGSVPSMAGLKGETREVADPTGLLVNPGYMFKGWTDGETIYEVGEMVTFPANLTAVWEAAVSSTISFEAGADDVTGTAPDAIEDVLTGDTIVFPANTFAKQDMIFIGWTKDNGATLYKAGEEMVFGANGDVVYYPYFANKAIMGSASTEFDTDGNTEGWYGIYDIKSFEAKNGVLTVVKNSASDARFGWNIGGDDGINGYSDQPMPAYYNRIVMRYRMFQEHEVIYGYTRFRFNRVGDADWTSAVAAEMGGRAFNEAAPRIPDGEWHTITWDINSANWNGSINAFFMDFFNENWDRDVRVDFDYIRFYRTGDKTVKYDMNLLDGYFEGDIEKSIANDTKAAEGTGYMLTNDEPKVWGCTFLGWGATPDATEYITSVDVGEDGATVYAIWEETDYEIEVVYDINGVEDVETVEVDEDTMYATVTLKEFDGTAPEGFVFSHWEVDGEAYEPGAEFVINKTLKVKAVFASMPFEVSFAGGEGATGSVDSYELRAGETIVFPANGFEKEGYFFAGWSYDGVVYPANKVGMGEAVLPKMPAEDITVTAVWSKVHVLEDNDTGTSIYAGVNSNGVIDFENGVNPLVAQSAMTEIVVDPKDPTNHVLKVTLGHAYDNIYQKVSGFVTENALVMYKFKLMGEANANENTKLTASFNELAGASLSTYYNGTGKGEWGTVIGFGGIPKTDDREIIFKFYSEPLTGTTMTGNHGTYYIDDIEVKFAKAVYYEKAEGTKLSGFTGVDGEEINYTYTVLPEMADVFTPTVVAERTDGANLEFKGWSLDGETVQESFEVESSMTLIPVWGTPGEDEEPVGKLGDADGNGEVDVSDATTMLRALAQLDTLDENAQIRADINGDGYFDVSDATEMLRFLAQLGCDYPVGEDIIK